MLSEFVKGEDDVIRKNQELLNMVNMVLDVLLIFLAYVVATYIRFDLMYGPVPALQLVWSKEYFEIAAGYAVALVAVYYVARLYGSYRFQSRLKELGTILAINAIGTTVLTALLYITRFADFSRLAIFFFFAFSTLFVGIKRFVLRALLRIWRRKGYNTKYFVVLGSGRLAEEYWSEIQRNPQFGCKILGNIATNESKNMQPYLGDYSVLRDVLCKRTVDEVVIGMQNAGYEKIGEIISICGRYGAKVSVIPAYSDFIPSTPTIEHVGKIKLINVRRNPNRGILWSVVKRLMDICIALCALVIALPFMLLTAILIRCESQGPVIFRQVRVGKNGKEFKMYKFRSMYQDAEERLKELEHQNEADGPVFKMVNDPRITRVGRIIRKTSIDELPQLWNVLKGEMSIVGPRPPLPREVAQYSDWDWGRLAVKPGLTCFWQISGRSDVSFDEWMKLDLKYVEEQSILTDLEILVKTVAVVITGKGAY